jgi:hypothetical protein
VYFLNVCPGSFIGHEIENGNSDWKCLMLTGAAGRLDEGGQ